MGHLLTTRYVWAGELCRWKEKDTVPVWQWGEGRVHDYSKMIATDILEKECIFEERQGSRV